MGTESPFETTDVRVTKRAIVPKTNRMERYRAPVSIDVGTGSVSVDVTNDCPHPVRVTITVEYPAGQDD